MAKRKLLDGTAASMFSKRMELEARRQELQMALDADRSQEERNKLGQFATPLELAREVARAALNYLRGPIRFFDPSIGSGSFFSALLNERGHRKLASARGIELDERFVKAARNLWSDAGLVVNNGDFTKLKPHTENATRATLVLANPPYVRHHHLDREQKIGLQRRAESMLRCKVSGLSGLYVYFVLLTHEWMSDDGVAAWLIPSEWMDVNYGAALKEYLCSRVTLLRVHRFDAADVQFKDALVSSAVVLFRKREAPKGGVCDMTVGSLSAPVRSQQISLTELRHAPKWSFYFRPNGQEHKMDVPTVTLGDLFDVKRGIATGANDFFVRPRAEFQAIGIPDKFLRPVLPSSRHLTGAVIERGPDGYPKLEVPLALLDCNLPEEQVRKAFPKLWSYLESPEGQQVRTGYLTSGRRPWYSQEQRASAPIVATYMGRGGRMTKPFKFFWNRSDATATNVYLMLIPKGEIADVLGAEPEKAKAIRAFLDETDVSELLGHGRVYGGGLHKLEPKELGRLDASRLVRDLGLAVSLHPSWRSRGARTRPRPRRAPGRGLPPPRSRAQHGPLRARPPAHSR
jgi:hypothetical protein